MCIIGHGKLMMEDGSYYEGSFVKGEIEGHGYRVFGNTGSTYTGMDIWLDGWINGWRDGWIDRPIDKWMVDEWL